MVYRMAILSAALMAGIGFKTPAYAIASAEVPFVGCKSDGQVGPQDAPIGKPKAIAISPQLAQRVAYYKASDGEGVLGPRGWYCFGTYGSSGSNLYVTPMPLKSADLFSNSWKGISSFGIQFSVSNGDTSGRFEVAQIIARVFPAHSAFVRRVIAEGVEPSTSFPYGPYPADKLTYKSKETVASEGAKAQETNWIDGLQANLLGRPTALLSCYGGHERACHKTRTHNWHRDVFPAREFGRCPSGGPECRPGARPGHRMRAGRRAAGMKMRSRSCRLR